VLLAKEITEKGEAWCDYAASVINKAFPETEVIHVEGR
jgi:hypothetical protein